MASNYDVDQLPTTSARAIEEFDDRFIAVQGTFSPNKWFDMLGLFEGMSTPELTFVMSQLGLKYQATRGDSRFKQSVEHGFTLRSSEFDEGIEAKLLDLYQQTFAWRRWNEGPGLLTIAEERFRGTTVRTLLEAGASTACGYDEDYFFDTDHHVNLGDSSIGTFSNYTSGGLDVVSVPNIQAQIVDMADNLLDENGEHIENNRWMIGVPVEKYLPLKNLLKSELIVSAGGAGTVSNPFANDASIQVMQMPQLTGAKDWYIFALDVVDQLPPWFMLKYNVPASLALRRYDESSDFFRDTGKIKVSSHIHYASGYGFPHGVRLVVGA